MPLRDEKRTLLSEKETIVSKRFVPGWSIPAIMFAQISFCIFAWTFAGLMMRNTIPLPDSRAAWIQGNPGETQVVITLISTILALIGSSLLGKAVECALVRRLSYAPLHILTMVEWTKLAQRTISFKRGLSWSLFSVVWVSLLGFLTTAWSSLLAPESVVIYHNLKGNETNLLNPSVSDLFLGHVGSQPLPGFNLTPATYTAFYLGGAYEGIDPLAALMDSGSWAASARVYSDQNVPLGVNSINIPGSLYLSNISTGGIFPTGDLALPPSWQLTMQDLLYQGLSKTYSVTQQGFTANVSCRMPAPNDPFISLNLMNSALISADAHNTWSMDTYSWSTNCSSEVEYSTLGVTVIDGLVPQIRGQNPLLMTSVCFGQDFSGSSNQSFLVLLAAPSNSNYTLFNQTCQVTPLVTTVQATYDQTDIVNITQPPLDRHPLLDPIGTNNMSVLLWFPAYTIWQTFVISQGLTLNRMGDRLLVFGGMDESPVIEDFLRGMMEFLGSVMAQEVSVVNFTDAALNTTFSGTINIRTFGWMFHPRTHVPSLIAITLVTLLTVAAGGFAMMIPIDPPDGTSPGQTCDVRAARARAFNPTSTMDVLLASSAGNLARVLSGSGGTYFDARISSKHGYDRHGVDEHLAVMLGMTDEGWPALRAGSSVHHDCFAAGSGQGQDEDEDEDEDEDGSKVRSRSSGDIARRRGEEMELDEMQARTG